MIRALIGNTMEMLLDRPFRARDHILRATSADGLAWRKDEAFRYRYPIWHRDRMSYYVGRDGDGVLWFRSSVQQGVRWITELRSAHRVLRPDAMAAGPVGGFSWLGQRLYVARRGDGKSMSSAVLAFDIPGGGAELRPVPTEWDGLDLTAVIEDVHVVGVGRDFLRAWVSINHGGACGTRIEHYGSRDGLSWARLPCRMEGVGGYANNPCVIEAAPRCWRMYFRIGDRPAVGNAICSAVSTDLESWQLEPGVRVAPGGRWDTHGAAFPHVERDRDGGYVMHYTGYWGRCSEGAAAARYWESQPRVRARVA